MTTFRQLHNAAEIRAAGAAGDEIEFTSNAGGNDHVDMPPASEGGSGGWIVISAHRIDDLDDDYVDKKLDAKDGMFRARGTT